MKMNEHKEKSAAETAISVAENKNIHNSNIAQSENDCKILFGARLKKVRKSRRIRTKDLAESLCCSRAGYSNYEIGNRFPSLKVLIKLSKILNVSTDYLFGLSPVQSSDNIKIRQVCEYTGLSEEVVEALHRNATVEQIHLTLPISEKISINQLINNLFKE